MAHMALKVNTIVHYIGVGNLNFMYTIMYTYPCHDLMIGSPGPA